MYNTTEFKMNELLGSVENLIKLLNFILAAKLFTEQTKEVLALWPKPIKTITQGQYV